MGEMIAAAVEWFVSTLREEWFWATQTPIPKYGSHRNVYIRHISRRDIRKPAKGDYTVYPYA